jgi:hypothetical protein
MPRIDDDEYEEEIDDSYNATEAAASYATDFPALTTTGPPTPLQAMTTMLRAINASLPNVTVHRIDEAALQTARTQLEQTTLDGAWDVANITKDASLGASLATEATMADIRNTLPPHVVHQELTDLLHSSMGAAKQALEKLLREAMDSLQDGYQGSARNNTETLHRALGEYQRDPDSAWMPSPDLPWAVAITAITAGGLLALVASRWIYARRTATSATLAVSRPNRIANTVARMLMDEPTEAVVDQVSIEMAQSEPQDLTARRGQPPGSPHQAATGLMAPPPTPAASTSASASLSERSQQTTLL